MVKTDKCIDASKILGGVCQACPPKSVTMIFRSPSAS